MPKMICVDDLSVEELYALKRNLDAELLRRGAKVTLENRMRKHEDSEPIEFTRNPSLNYLRRKGLAK